MPGDTFERARAAISRSWIESEFRANGSYWKGDEFYTLNPMRADKTVKSFHIRSDGRFFDHATQDGGDVFDLLAAIRGCQPIDIARDLSGESTSIPSRPAPARPAPAPDTKPAARDWSPIGDDDRPPFAHDPAFVTLYRHPETGDGLFLVRRYELPGGKKDIMPIYRSALGTWEKGIPDTVKFRPLADFPRGQGKTVVLVEGEKCYHLARAYFAQRELNQYAVTTWHGGAGAAKKACWSQLYGEDVVIWPDADDPGVEAADTAMVALEGKATVRVVVVPSGVEKGWDIADAIAEKRNIQVLIETSAAPQRATASTLPVAQNLSSHPYTDLGNAELLVDMFEGKMRWNVDRGAWMIWDTRHWNTEDQTLATVAVRKVIDLIHSRGDATSLAYSIKLQSKARIDAMLDLAKRQPGIPVREKDLDTEEFLVSTPSGCVDIRTGKLSEADKESLHSKLTGAPYNSEATCPRFMQFLDEIFLGDRDIIGFMQRWFGYCLTSDISAQSFVICYGLGANGKSTLVEVISRVMGDYAQSAPPDMFIQKQSSGIPNDIATLRGARMVLTTETESNARLAETKIKSLTGGDMITARYMRGEFFSFKPSHKIVISTNHKPRIYGSDHGIWRRVLMVPFRFTATGDQLDPDLPKKLWAEREGILAWVVAGARQWYEAGGGRKGLMVPGVIAEEVQTYREDEDSMGKFIEERCIRQGDADDAFPMMEKHERVMVLYEAFKEWAKGQGESRLADMSQKSFTRGMEERGFTTVRKSEGKRYVGIQLRREEGVR